MNILIVEDDIYLSAKIKETFQQKAFTNQIHILHSYNCFLSNSSLDKYDIILLDIMLGDDKNKSWLQILEHVRKRNIIIPVIIMSNISDYGFLETAFSLWAHDYVIKPFRVRELQIRIQRWFHNYVFRESYSYERCLDYKGLLYYPHKSIFIYEWKTIVLSRSNKYLLSLLIIYRETILSHMFLVDKIWGCSDNYESKNLRIKILRLKKQLQDHGIDNWIVTIHWEWYILQQPNLQQS